MACQESHSQRGRAGSPYSSDSYMLFVLHLKKSDLKHRCLVGGMKHGVMPTSNGVRAENKTFVSVIIWQKIRLLWSGVEHSEKRQEQFPLGETALGTLHLVLGSSFRGLWKPAGWGSKESSKTMKGLLALINKGILKELNMYSSAKQRLGKSKLNVY